MEKEKEKIMSNMDREYLSNVLGAIYSYSEKNCIIPIKPSELEITLNFIVGRRDKHHLSKISLEYISYNSKRDLKKIKNIFSYDILSKPESRKNKFHNPDLSCKFENKLRKNQIFQPENYTFYIQDKEIIKFEFPKNNKKYDLFFYSRNADNSLINSINNSINFIEKNFSENFETIYYIILIYKIEQIKIYQNLIFDLIKNFKENPNKYKLIYLQNPELYNIFDFQSSYFFITDSEQKIITLNQISKFQNKIRKIINQNPKKDKTYYLNILSQLYNFFKKAINQLPYIYSLYSEYLIKIKLNDDLTEIIPIEVVDFKCEGELRTNEYNFILNSLDELNFKKQFNQLKELETFEINVPLNILCSNCNEKIPEEKGLYYCHWCQIFFCEKCTEDKLKNTSDNIEQYRNNLIHREHNLIYFSTRKKENLKNLDKNRLGNNLFASSELHLLTYDHKAICNGCRRYLNTSSLNIRYLCMSCRPGKIISGGFADYCLICFNDMRSNEERRKNIENIYTLDDDYSNNVVRQHSHFNHVYLTIPIAVRNDNYYEF